MASRIFCKTVLLLFVLWLGTSVAPPALAQEGQQKLIPLRFQLRDADVTKVTAIIALEEGIFRKNGLDVDLYIDEHAAQTNKVRGGPEPPARYVRSGESPIWMGGGAPTVVRVTTNAAAWAR